MVRRKRVSSSSSESDSSIDSDDDDINFQNIFKKLNHKKVLKKVKKVYESLTLKNPTTVISVLFGFLVLPMLPLFSSRNNLSNPAHCVVADSDYDHYQCQLPKGYEISGVLGNTFQMQPQEGYDRNRSTLSILLALSLVSLLAMFYVPSFQKFLKDFRKVTEKKVEKKNGKNEKRKKTKKLKKGSKSKVKLKNIFGEPESRNRLLDISDVSSSDSDYSSQYSEYSDSDSSLHSDSDYSYGYDYDY